MKGALRVLGTGRIFSGLGGYLSSQEFDTLAFTTKEIDYTHEEMVLLGEETVYRTFKVLWIADSFDTVDIESLRRPDIKIYIVNVDHHEALLTSDEDVTIVSCCKDGLNNKYVPILKRTCCTGMIVAIDNDKSIAARAEKTLGKQFKVKSAVIDMYCPHELRHNKKHTIAYAYVKRDAYIVFPPRCDQLKRFFKVDISNSVLQVRYAKTQREYDENVILKLYNVNIPHMIMAIQAWNYYKYDATKVGSFADIPDIVYEQMKDVTLWYHYQICLSWLKEEKSRVDSVLDDISDTIALYSAVAEARLDCLREGNDAVVRIINPMSSAALNKIEVLMTQVNKAYPQERLLKKIVSYLSE